MGDAPDRLDSVCVFCGSSDAADPALLASAAELGRGLAAAELTMIYGGGGVGLMGACAVAAHEAGGKVLGIIPAFLTERERRLDVVETVVVESMHERKMMMFERSDGFVVLPGGIGTLEEIVEVMTWAQLGRHRKPMVFANIGGFWDPMLKLIRHMADEGFIHTAHLVQPLVIDEPGEIVATLLDHWAGQIDREGEAGIIARL